MFHDGLVCRTASDLEEKGLISNVEKGVIKDLIISGDAKFLAAMETYEKGDRTELSKLCRSLISRKGTVDLLENMDLDFVFEDKGGAEDVAVFASSVEFSSTRSPPGIAARRPSIDHHVRSNSIFGIADGEAPLTSFNSSVFDDTQHQIELSAYEAMAKSLSGSKSVNGKGTKDKISGRTTPARPSSRGLASEDRQKGYMTTRLVSSPFITPSQSLATSTRQSRSTASQAAVASTSSSLPMRVSTISTAPATSAQPLPSSSSGSSEIVTRIPTNPSPGVAALPAASSTAHGNGNAAMVKEDTKSEEIKQSGSIISPLGAVQSSPSINGVASQSGGTSNPSSSANPTVGTAIAATTPAVINTNATSNTVGIGSSGGGERSDSGAEVRMVNTKDVVSMTIAGGPLWAKSVDGQRHFIGAYSPEQRRKRIERFIEKRNRRVWTKKVKYDVRKNFADSRLRVKGRFVKKEDEEIMRELMTI